jgi:hypothetical protein
MRLDADSRQPPLFFTDEGLVELRAMMADRRLADPVTFAHIRREPGVEAVQFPSSVAGQSRHAPNDSIGLAVSHLLLRFYMTFVEVTTPLPER